MAPSRNAHRSRHRATAGKSSSLELVHPIKIEYYFIFSFSFLFLFWKEEEKRESIKEEVEFNGEALVFVD